VSKKCYKIALYYMPLALSHLRGGGGEREEKEFPVILNYIKLICTNAVSTRCHIISIFKGDWGRNVSTGVKVGTNYSGVLKELQLTWCYSR
jgi:hypothetical protein